MSKNRKGSDRGKQVGELGPKDGCPTGSLVIQCTSGPVYSLLLHGDSPEDLRAAILRAAEECQQIEALAKHENDEKRRREEKRQIGKS